MLDRDAGSDIRLVYATPIMCHVWPEAERVNPGLARLLLRLEQQEPEHKTGGLRYSNHGGWRSLANLLERGEPEIKTLTGWIGQAANVMMRLATGHEEGGFEGQFQIVAWANINRQGAYDVIHKHPGNHWSGVYYVDAGEADPEVLMSGMFEFHDPRPDTTMSRIPGFDFGDTTAMRPRDGMMLLFPSWLAYSVHPYTGQKPRISISFNIKLTNFKLLSDDTA